jgi:sugar/nucleoside kinase (ribokinase family)
MSKVIGIGSAVFDILAQCDKYPVEDTKMACNAMKYQGGGPCATALVAASRLGLESEYWGCISDDQAGLFIRKDFQRYGVGTDTLKTVDGYHSFSSYVLCSSEHASRTCIYFPGDVPPPQPADFPLEKLDGARFLHLDGYYPMLALPAVQHAKKQGIAVSLDAGTLNGSIEDLLPFVDILIASESFAGQISGTSQMEEAIAFLGKTYHPDVLVVTQGSKGGLLWSEGRAKSYPAFPVSAVDTNGAGDVFHGAMLCALDRGLDPYESCVFSSAVSALKCMVFGAREGIPSFEDVMDFLHENHISLAKS